MDRNVHKIAWSFWGSEPQTTQTGGKYKLCIHTPKMKGSQDLVAEQIYDKGTCELTYSPFTVSMLHQIRAQNLLILTQENTEREGVDREKGQ